MKMLEPVLPGADEESIALERALLGRLLIHPDRLYEVSNILTPSMFYRIVHQYIFEAMLVLHHAGKAIDSFQVEETCRRLHMHMSEEELPDFVTINDLTNYDPWYNDLPGNAHLLAQKAFARDLIAKAFAIAAIGQAGGPIPDMLARVSEELDALTKTRPVRSVSLSEVMESVLAELDDAYEHRHTTVGIETGLHPLDAHLGPMRAGNLVLIAARPSMGKSALAFQIGYHAALKGKEVATYSLEMQKEEIGRRYLLLDLAAHGVFLDSKKLENGWLLEHEWDNVIAATDRLAALPLTIDDTSGSPVSAIRDDLLRRASARGKPADLVIVDYLQLMDSSSPKTDGRRYRDNTRVQEVDQISRGLKGIAKDFHVPVIACAQLNRAVEGRMDKRPQLSDLRESGGLEQDAHIVLMLYRDEYYHQPDPVSGEETSTCPGIAELMIVKNRNGETGSITLRWVKESTHFEDRIAERNERDGYSISE